MVREDTSPDTVPETKVALKRIRTTKEGITLTLQRMMNLQERESKKKTLLVMENSFDFYSHGNCHTWK